MRSRLFVCVATVGALSAIAASNTPARAQLPPPARGVPVIAHPRSAVAQRNGRWEHRALYWVLSATTARFSLLM